MPRETIMQHCPVKLFFNEITLTYVGVILMAVQETYISHLSFETSDYYYHIGDIRRLLGSLLSEPLKLRRLQVYWTIAKTFSTKSKV